ncbi:MAG: L,D-transpeptidase family protein [Anaerolineales bacterium]
MTNEINITAAKQALRHGDKKTARQIAQKIIATDPSNEDGWLILAALSPPETAVKYLKRVLDINPQNAAAQKGLAWFTIQQSQPLQQPIPAPPSVTDRKQPFQVKRKQIIWPWFLILCGITLLALFQIHAIPTLAFPIFQQMPTPVITETLLIESPSLTPTPTSTETPTPLPTQTVTPTPTTTITPTPTNPPPTATEQAKAVSKSNTKKKNQQSKNSTSNNKAPTNPPPISPPKGVSANEHWIEVDLSSQRSYAYIGSSRVKSFIVSTGTWLHPTVTGVFKIYVKYRYANMSGPGYYLPNVPYVMYFYQDYGLHGTYWHHNFGVPMSHGCVNYSIPDAAWLFDFANVGTIVYIHP